MILGKNERPLYQNKTYILTSRTIRASWQSQYVDLTFRLFNGKQIYWETKL